MFLALFFSLDVLYPSTPSAKSIVSTNPSYPTQGRYLSLSISPSCAIQGALPLLISLDVLHPSTSSANSTPGTNSSHPTQGKYPPLGVSPFVLFRVLHQVKGLRSRTPPQCLEVILFTESPHSCDNPLNVCETILNQNDLHLGIPRMHSGPLLARGKNKVSFIHYLHHHFLVVTTFSHEILFISS